MISIKRFFLKNLHLKLLSIFFAIVLWSFVHSERRTEVSISVPLELTNIPAGLMVVNDVEKAIDIRVLGPQTIVRSLSSKTIKLSVDLKGAKPGITHVEILPRNFPVPRGVMITRISPAYISINLAKITKKEVTVRPIFKGNLPEDYEIKKVTINPSKVTITGAIDELKTISYVETEVIKLEGIKKDTEIKVPIKISTSSHIKEISTDKVVVKIEVQEKIITKTFPGLKFNILNPPSLPFTFTPKRVKIVVRGPIKIIKNLKEKDISLSIDISKWESNPQKFPIMVKVPQKVEVLKKEPEMITVEGS